MKSAEEILENELNNIGYSFRDELVPVEIIKLSVAKKIKKSILKAMVVYAKQQATPLQDEIIKELLTLFEEVIRISDRNHDVWNVAKKAIENAREYLSNNRKTDEGHYFAE